MDPIEMFKKNPGRYELWHIKDAACTDSSAMERSRSKPSQFTTPMKGKNQIIP
jgi:hypothetical protein